MKKIILIVLVALAALAVFATAAFAATPAAGNTSAPAQARGYIGEYIAEALAAKLGISVDTVNAALVAGKSHYQIALEAGIAEADIPALLEEVHNAALDKAVADGVITQEQADFMKTRMDGQYGGGFGRGGRGGMMGGGYAPRDGSGPMHAYLAEAFAAKLGITTEALDAARLEGKTLYDVALEAGIAESDIPALLEEVHNAALDKAVADGVITQEQADFMKTRMGGQYGNCGGSYQPRGGRGMMGGGGMYGGGGMRGGGWQQPNP